MRQFTRQRSVVRVVGAMALAAGLVGGLAGCGSDEAADAAAQQSAVSSSYQSFATAVDAKDGARAAKLLSASSLTYFDGLRTSALDDTKAELRRRDTIDQLTVLSMRAEIPVSVLRTGSPAEVVAAGVTEGVINGGSNPQQGLSQVVVNGDRATAALTLAGQGNPVGKLGFVREQGVWKFDLTSMHAIGLAGIEQAKKASKLTDDELVEQVQISRVGAAEAKRAWSPLGRA